jgi:hypothetical protein
VLLLGCTALGVDYSILISDKNQLQRACDAAALAGASKLPDPTAAQTVAGRVAALNRVPDDDNNDVSFELLQDNSRLRVTAVRRRQLFFARMLGQNTGIVRAKATAALNANTTPLVVPIGIDTATYSTYAPQGVPLTGEGNRAVLTLVRHNFEPFGLNHAVLFDLRSEKTNAKSPIFMRDQLDGSADPAPEVRATTPPSDFVEALNDAYIPQARNFVAAMRVRFQLASTAPWFDADPQNPPDAINSVGQHYESVYNGVEPTNGLAPFYRNPRIMNLIVTQSAPVPAGGNMNTPVIAFAPVYVEKVESDDESTKMTVRFLPHTSAVSAGKAALVE